MNMKVPPSGIPSFSPIQDGKPADVQQQKKPDLSEPVSQSAVSKANLRRGESTQRRRLSLPQVDATKPSSVKALPAHDAVSLAATASTFNPYIKALKPVRDDTVVGFNGLTQGEENKLFPNLSVGFVDSNAQREKAAEFVANHFKPSLSVGF
ncbi:MAG TPA: hypothetical protein VM571_14935 [Noviherbaspirillum sp.]|nr:hypothetical protein [Noviherbaspirillum sp.]